MNVYLVRMVDGKEAVGIFWARNLDDLWLVVDEITNPGDCECAKITKTGEAGGVAWAGRTELTFPPAPEPDDDVDLRMAETSTTWSLCASILHADKLRWTAADKEI